MSANFFIRKGDLLPILNFQALYDLGNPIDLSNANVKFIMTLEDAPVPKISTAVGVNISDFVNGIGSYTWQGTDTDTAGEYIAYIEATFPSGKKITAPNKGFITILIEDVE